MPGRNSKTTPTSLTGKERGGSSFTFSVSSSSRLFFFSFFFFSFLLFFFPCSIPQPCSPFLFFSFSSLLLECLQLLFSELLPTPLSLQAPSIMTVCGGIDVKEGAQLSLGLVLIAEILRRQGRCLPLAREPVEHPSCRVNVIWIRPRSEPRSGVGILLGVWGVPGVLLVLLSIWCCRVVVTMDSRVVAIGQTSRRRRWGGWRRRGQPVGCVRVVHTRWSGGRIWYTGVLPL
jgi:hypothetical protein